MRIHRWSSARMLMIGAAVLACLVIDPAAARADPTFRGDSTTRADPTAPADAATRGDAAAGSVSLTFDDGPSAYTPAVLDVLAREGVTATFCLVGTEARRYPALVRRIVAEGHALCNHSMNHDDLSTWTPEAVRADLSATTAIIRQAVPGVPVPYFRAPYGSWGGSAAVAAELGMSRLGWTVDPRDWSRPGTDVIVQEVLAQLRPGGIVLMHDAGGDRTQTVEALGILIPRLRQDGWTFTLPARTSP